MLGMVLFGSCGYPMANCLYEINLKKNLGKFVPYLAIFEGIVTAWIPGLLMLWGKW